MDQAEQHPDRRGLAGAVRTEETVELTPIDGEIEAVDGGEVAVPLAQTDRSDRCRHGSAAARACNVATSTGPTSSQFLPACSVSIADHSGPLYGSNDVTSGGSGWGNGIATDVAKHDPATTSRSLAGISS
jgi:hypothetical protein